jgi:hypothetical protein
MLASLGADPYLRDVVLGDLAEEFATRLEFDGAPAARRWYLGEAIRNIPFLLRSWRRGATWRDVPRILGIAAKAYGLLLLIGLLLDTIGFAAWVVLDLPPLRQLVLNTGAAAFVSLSLAVMVSCLGGYFAAKLDDRTPIVSAVSFGVLWAAVDSIIAAAAGFGPPWYRMLLPLIFVAGTLAGGLFRVTRSDEPEPVRD